MHFAGTFLFTALLHLLHPFYIAMTDINFNKQDKALEVSVRIFTDDFESALRKHHSGINIDILYPANQEQGNGEMMKKGINSIRELYKMLKVEKEFDKKDEELKSYDIAHHVGLSLQEEYELLGLMQEKQRQEYIRRHLTRVIPMVAEMEGLKKKVKLNGHFKNLSSFDFKI